MYVSSSILNFKVDMTPFQVGHDSISSKISYFESDIMSFE